MTRRSTSPRAAARAVSRTSGRVALAAMAALAAGALAWSIVGALAPALRQAAASGAGYAPTVAPPAAPPVAPATPPAAAPGVVPAGGSAASSAAAPVQGGASGGAVDEVGGLNDRARTALDAGRPADAVLLLEKACKLEPDEPVLRRNLAWAYFQRGQQQLKRRDSGAAAGDYRRAVELNADEIGYRVHLGQLLLGEYRLAEAETVLRGAVKDRPDSGDSWLVLGDTLSLLDRLGEAIDAYDRAAGSTDADVARIASAASGRVRRQEAVEKDYRTDSTTYFTIRGPAQNQGPLFGVQLAGVLERARSEVCNALSHFPSQKTTVVLYPPDAFREVTGTHEWVGGLFDRKIRLPIADVERDQAQIEAAFRHEFTHLIVSEVTPACPTFVNEGLAQLQELGRGRGMGRLTAWLDGHPGGREALPRVAELPESFVDIVDRDTVSLAYLFSYAFVDHVASLHGLGSVMRWIEALASQPLDQAYETATGRSLAAEEALFRDEVRSAR